MPHPYSIPGRLLLALLLSSPLLAADIPALKPLYPATPFVQAGRAAVVVVRPSDPAWIDLAAAAASAIGARTGATPAVVSDDALVDSSRRLDVAALGGRHVVALGNMASNRLLGVLWMQGYTFEDDGFPGRGGWVVRSVHDPFGQGLNVVVVAGSSPTEVAVALRHLTNDLLPGPSGLPGPVLTVQRGAPPQPYGDSPTAPSVRDPFQFTAPAEYVGTLAERVAAIRSHQQDEAKARIPTLTNVTTVLSQLARAWAHTGDPGYPPLMKHLVDEHRSLLRVIPERVEMEPASASAMMWWDLVEELPVWTDADRIEITNAFYADARQGHEHTPAHEAVREGYRQILTENHGTNSVLHTFDHWRYLAKYYDLPEERYWLEVVAAVFAGQIASHQIVEDAALYTPFSPDDAMLYAMRSGDMRYFDLGIAGTQTEFIMTACLSNLGFSSGFGDSRMLQYPWAWQPAAMAGWFLRDPVAQWWWRHYLPVICGIPTYAEGLPIDNTVGMREPVEWTGMTVFPVFAQALGDEKRSREVVTTPKAAAGPEWFNKVIFRDRWSPEAQFLLLDGAGASPPRPGEPSGPKGHSHSDVNSIITFTAGHRMWLVDHTYAARSPQDHNGLVITRDGEMEFQNHLARLTHHAQGGGFAVSRSLFDNFSGATWERVIFWRRGEHFVVLDRAVAEVAGRFTARNAWRGLGEHQLQDGELRLTQAGQHAQVRSDGRAAAGVELFPFPDAAFWKVYAHAEPVAKVFDQFQAAELQPGQALAFGNLLKAAADPAVLDATALVRLGERTLWVRDGAYEALCGVGPTPGEWSDAAVYLLSTEGALLVDAARFARGRLRADRPVTWVVDAGDGVTVRLTEAARVTIDGVETMYPAGEYTLTVKGLGADLRALLADVRARAGAVTEGTTADADATATATAARMEKTPVQAWDTSVRQVVEVGLNPGEEPTRLVTGDRGLSAFDVAGNLRWRFDPGAACGALAVADTNRDGRMEIVVGSDDEHVYGVDADGRETWRFRCQSTIAGGPPVPDAIRIVDLDADGAFEVVVAANFMHLLRPDGTLLWEDYWRFQRNRRVGDVQSFDLADIDGDGRLDIVCGIQLNYSIALAWNVEGRRVYPADPTGQPNHRVLRVGWPRATRVVNLFADEGLPQIVVASADGLNLRWIGGERDTLRGGDLAGGRVALAVADAGELKPLIVSSTDMGALLAHRASGSRADGVKIDLPIVWRAILGDKVTCLEVGTVGQREVIAVGTRGGRILLLEPGDGRVLAETRVGNAPVRAAWISTQGFHFADEAGRLAGLRVDGAASVEVR